MGTGDSILSMLTIKLHVRYDSPHSNHPPPMKPQTNPPPEKKKKKNQINLRHDNTTQRDKDTNVFPSSHQTEKEAVHQLYRRRVALLHC